MKYLTALLFIFLSEFSYSQVDPLEVLSYAIKEDSIEYYKRIKESKNQKFLCIKDKLFNYEQKEISKYVSGFEMTIINDREYSKLKSKKGRPIITIESLMFQNDLLIFNVLGSDYLYRRKKKSCFYVFSDLLIRYKFNCVTMSWELLDIKNLN